MASANWPPLFGSAAWWVHAELLGWQPEQTLLAVAGELENSQAGSIPARTSFNMKGKTMGKDAGQDVLVVGDDVLQWVVGLGWVM